MPSIIQVVDQECPPSTEDSLPEVSHSPPETMGTIELLCPHCDYNLTGLPEDRCPECGEAFDREGLIALYGEAHQPILASMRLTDGIGKVLASSLFTPGRIGRELNIRCDSSQTIFYGLITKVLAVIGLIVFTTIVSGGNAGHEIIIGSFIMVGISSLVEICLALLMSRYLVPARPVPRRFRYAFWRNLCRCFSVHLPITLLLIILTIASMMLDYHQNPWAVLVAFGISLCWWWINIGQAIWASSRPSVSREVMILLIPVVSIGVVVVCCVLIGLVCNLLYR